MELLQILKVKYYNSDGLRAGRIAGFAVALRPGQSHVAVFARGAVRGFYKNIEKTCKGIPLCREGTGNSSAG